MDKFSEENEIEELEKLPELDYSRLPEEVMGAVSEKPYIVIKTAKITWDGKQFGVKIPTEIVEEMGITSENRLRFTMTKHLPKSGGGIELEIELI